MRALLIALLVGLLAGCVTPPSTADGSGSAEARPTRASSEPGDPDKRAKARLDLAAAYFGGGKLDTALTEAKAALAIKPELPGAYTLLGLIYASMGDARQAEQNFQRAQQVQPGDPDVMHNYGWFLCQERRFKEAQAQFNAALAQPQYREPARTMLAAGVCLARDNQWEDAERLLARSFELDPANPAVAYNLSEVLYRRGQYERARFYIRRVNSVPSYSNAQTLWLAARIERRAGDMAAMQDFARQLRDRYPQSSEAARLEQGRFDD